MPACNAELALSILHHIAAVTGRCTPGALHQQIHVGSRRSCLITAHIGGGYGPFGEVFRGHAELRQCGSCHYRASIFPLNGKYRQVVREERDLHAWREVPGDVVYEDDKQQRRQYRALWRALPDAAVTAKLAVQPHRAGEMTLEVGGTRLQGPQGNPL